MKALMQRMSAFWDGLGSRERLILVGGGTLAAILLLYGLIWAPLQQDLTRLRKDLPKAQQDLQWMRAQAGRVQQLRANSPRATQGGGLMSFVEQSAQSYGIQQNMKRVEPDGSNGARVSLDGVAFNNFLSWLSHLQKQGGIRVDNATIEPQSAPGTVNVRLVLRAGTA